MCFSETAKVVQTWNGNSHLSLPPRWQALPLHLIDNPEAGTITIPTYSGEKRGSERLIISSREPNS